MKYEYVVYDCGHEYYRTEAYRMLRDDGGHVYSYTDSSGKPKICVTDGVTGRDLINYHGQIELVKYTMSAVEYLGDYVGHNLAVEILKTLGVEPNKKVEVE